MTFFSSCRITAGRRLQQVVVGQQRRVVVRNANVACTTNVASASVLFFSSFCKEPTTTTVLPSVKHGPYGSGGTIVGFSKYDGVRSAFEENFARRLELGSQLVIYEKGEKTVDLYGYAPEMEEPSGGGGGGYDGDTLQCVYSSGKNMEAIVLAMLVDRGLVDYDDLVTKHWPEFGANGKQNITVADVMRHAGGVPFIIDPNSKKYLSDTILITPEDVANVDALETKICAAAKFPPDNNKDTDDVSSPMHYHAYTRGWIVNGVVRRVDPSGRSIGTFMREEITNQLGVDGDDVTFFCGIPKEEQSNYKFANMSEGSRLYNLMFLILPAFAGYGEKPIAEIVKYLMKKNGPGLKPVVSWMGKVPSFDFNDSMEGRSLEIPSAGMFANARSMAKINSAMAGDGSFNGVSLLSENGVRKSMDDIQSNVDLMGNTSFGFSKGGFCSFSHTFGDDIDIGNTRVFDPDDKKAYGNFKGWGGLGGSLSLVDREKDVSFAYCMNAGGLNIIGGPRTRRILLELQKVI